eukprot:355066-Chlamydomonas_euryale.AAC.16
MAGSQQLPPPQDVTDHVMIHASVGEYLHASDITPPASAERDGCKRRMTEQYDREELLLSHPMPSGVIGNGTQHSIVDPIPPVCERPPAHKQQKMSYVADPIHQTSAKNAKNSARKKSTPALRPRMARMQRCA